MSIRAARRQNLQTVTIPTGDDINTVRNLSRATMSTACPPQPDISITSKTLPPSFYAYDWGDWRIYALNSNIDVSATSTQLRWLKADLAANPRKCVLAYWHHPRWSSGNHHGGSSKMQAIWSTLYNANADLVLNGHEHHYERFKQMNASGAAVPSGLREIVVGTGGAPLYGFGTIHAASEVRNASAHGVLKLTLNTTSYSWNFVPVARQTFTDSGTTNCR